MPSDLPDLEELEEAGPAEGAEDERKRKAAEDALELKVADVRRSGVARTSTAAGGTFLTEEKEEEEPPTAQPAQAQASAQQQDAEAASCGESELEDDVRHLDLNDHEGVKLNELD